jgi:hypothetical protein
MQYLALHIFGGVNPTLCIYKGFKRNQ